MSDVNLLIILKRLEIGVIWWDDKVGKELKNDFRVVWTLRVENL